MDKLVLPSQKRSPQEVAKMLRKERLVPAVVYGRKQEAISLKLGASDVLKTHRVAGENHVVTLDVEGTKIDVLFHEVQRAPVSGDITHVDFYAIVKGEKVHANIPFVFVGTSRAKMEEWALIEEVLKHIEVKCLPEHLVDSFEVDLSKLDNVGDNIKVADLGISDKYEIDPTLLEEVVAVAAATREEVIEDTAPEAELPPEEKKEEGKSE